MSDKKPYHDLAQRMKDIMLLETSIGMLAWDIRTYMPPKGIAQRAQALGNLSKYQHELLTSEITGRMIAEAEKITSLDEVEQRNVFLWRKEYTKETRIPTDLVKKISEQENKTEHLWETAKVKNDYGMVKGELQTLYELIHKRAELIDPDKEPYNNLLDEFEPNITKDEVNSYFSELKNGVLKIVEKCTNSGRKPDLSLLKREAPKEQQKALSTFIMDFLGLKKDRSRLDEAEHPFTTGYGDDVRITTHYLEKDPMGSFYSVFHEAGHALYELNLPHDRLWTPVGTSIGLGVHESQSRFTENIIGKGDAFLSYAFPKIQKIVPSFQGVNYDDFLLAVNAVFPSKIRIYADEVTYNLHIILRFEVEKLLFDGKVTINELPQVWNEKMDEYLQQKIVDDADGGVLQDTHWYGGAFGYFPDYALGNIYDGMLLNSMKNAIPDWEGNLRRGDGKAILSWLDEKVHKLGSMYDPVDLIEHVCGEKPSARYFVEYMNEKYSKIYNF